ncbi:MAG: 3'-5' exoribonuclease [Candidatus Riesia sp.]|nr:3'-5' exoribonuclease [Candidatus Riesia sp.]
MKLFLDTEFTGLKTNAQLISIGIVAEDGSEFYAEFNDYETPTQWVVDNVLPLLLDQNYMYLARHNEKVIFDKDRDDIKYCLQIWLSQWDICEFVGDTLFIDWLLFLDLFEWQLPQNVYYLPLDITTMFWVCGIDPDITRVDFVGLDLHEYKHNALFDAQVIQKCFNKLMEMKINGNTE